MTDWRPINDALWQRSGGACEACGNHLVGVGSAARHHRRLRSAGGDDSLSNLLLLCHPCHTGAQGAHMHPARARGAGIIVSQYGPPPGEVPVEHARHGSVLLVDDGSVRKWTAPVLCRDLPPYLPNHRLAGE